MKDSIEQSFFLIILGVPLVDLDCILDHPLSAIMVPRLFYTSRLPPLHQRFLHVSGNSGPQRLQRVYTTSSKRVTDPSTSSQAKNVAFLTMVLSTAGISAFLYETYFSAKVQADAPTQLNPGASPKSQKIREILHSQKKDTLRGVDVDHILTRCEETILQSGPGVRRYDINQIAR